jgi:hypothetical protein
LIKAALQESRGEKYQFFMRATYLSHKRWPMLGFEGRTENIL